MVDKCSCKDCASSCRWIPKFPVIKTKFILGIFTYSQLAIIIAASFFFLTMCIIGCIKFCCCNRIYRSYTTSSNLLLNLNEHEQSDTNMSTNIAENNDLPDLNKHKNLQSDISETRIDVLHPNNNKSTLTTYLGIFSLYVAKFSTKYSILVASIFTIICIAFSSCIPFFLKITSDPVELWSSPHSEMHEQMKNYESLFGKFYRNEQIIISNKNKSIGITSEFLLYVNEIVNRVKSLEAYYNGTDNFDNSSTVVKLSDFCVKPLHPSSNECVIYSVMQYFQNNDKFINNPSFNWEKHLKICFNAPSYIPGKDSDDISCLSSFLQPINPKIVIGDYKNDDFFSANTLIITFVLSNPTLKTKRAKIYTWEQEFIKYAKSLLINNTKYDISFSSERSIEDEVSREALSNIKIVIISYVAMFLYVSVSLGKIPRSTKTFFVDTKFLLGLCGVLLVFLSITTSIGLLSMMGLKMNNIALEVLPFLILAIGVDNMFIISHAYYRIIENSEIHGVQNDGDNIDVDSCIHLAMQEVGPGIVISAITQIVIFGCGAISSVPVIRTFAIFASVTLLINFILQLTVFLSLFVLDSYREMNNRYNILCCMKSNNIQLQNIGDPDRYYVGPSRWFVKHVLGRMLLCEKIRFFIVVLFITIWLLSLSVIPLVHIGLDQTLALPKDSYLQSYFKDVFSKLKFGAPVYFVVGSGYNYHRIKEQNKICSLHNCDEHSLTNYIDIYSKYSNISRIATPSMSWLDSYLQWLDPTEIEGRYCCGVILKIKNHSKYKLSRIGEFCRDDHYSDPDGVSCGPCVHPKRPYKRPLMDQFTIYLPYFLEDIPKLNGCIFGGKPAFSKSVILNKKFYDRLGLRPISGLNPIIASSFMAYHTPLVTTDDFVDAIKKSMYISKNLTSLLGTNVYPYSVFYIFYESFLDMTYMCYKSLAICCVAVILATMLLFGGNMKMTIIVSLNVIFMNVINFAFLYIGQMELNPVSIVNLIMLFAINIEFVSHISFAYMSHYRGSQLEASYLALTSSGGSVFSGIALTKLIGISVLAFASSEIFKIYYFRMYMFAVVVGALHGLIFLPTILSYVGPQPEVSSDVDMNV